jgi:zinc transport system substrate-binding protein
MAMKKLTRRLITAVLFVYSVSSTMSASVDSIATDVGYESAGNNTSDNSSNIASQDPSSQYKVKAVASFYPIFEFVKKIGGDRVEVSSLIPPGIEPHDFDPTVQQVQNAETADILVYNGVGLEGPWIKKINAKFAIDSSQGLILPRTDGTEIIADDPHIWLDPILVKEQVKKIREGLIKVDPENTAYYNENAKEFISELDNLDGTIKSELSNCEKRDFIAFHNAFSYFADRYGLAQHSIQGLSPEAEILPQRIQQIIELARGYGIDTIYSEDLIDPRLANVIAQEIPNSKVLVLSPIEGIDKEEQNAGIGYLAKMKENVENLKTGLKCK